MRNLALKPQVITPNSEYPYGRIQDDTSTGADDGTPVNEEVYGDMHQFFAKLMAVAESLGGASYNNEPENAYDGFQSYDALVEVIEFGIAVGLNNAYEAQQTPSYSGTFIAHATSPVKYRRTGIYYNSVFTTKTVRIKGSINNSVPAASSTDDLVFTLPVGYRPAENQLFTVPTLDGTNYNTIVEIKTNGEVRMRGDYIAYANTNTYINISFDVD